MNFTLICRIFLEKRRSIIPLITLFLGLSFSINAQPVIRLQQFASGNLSNIIGLSHAGDERLFAVLQGGIIRVIEGNGNVIVTPFLNITTQVSSGGERGLLGLAFHPNYSENGFFYINYTRSNGNSVISRWQVSRDDPNRADPNSEMIIIEITQPYSNHNGGDLKFGPDGYLYIGMGDGGAGGDPQNYSQNPQSLLGKMLRIDIDGGMPYSIPAGNPYINAQDTLDELWGFGLRNPWRYSFDAHTGDLWIADVGQSAREEINKVTGPGTGLENYGWRCYEGSLPYNLNGCGAMNEYTFPVFEYPHSPGDKSVTGGYVYRGDKDPLLYGVYLCADFVSGKFFTVESDGNEYVGKAAGNFGEFQFATFGENVDTELFVAARGRGIVYRVRELCSDYIPSLSLDENELKLEFRNASWDDEKAQITWYKDGIEIELVGDSLFLLEESGTYYARITLTEGCDLSSNEVEFVKSSSNNTPVSDLWKISPNPVNDYLVVQSNNNELATMELWNHSGKRVMSFLFQDEAIINLNHMPSGVYSARLILNGRTESKILIKK
jgi:glucose/arabinose dehydrogenase